ncbi:AMP-binding protein [Tepidimonas taiwanensis]|uniref:Phenylacetate-coenzyme A ligase n=1 Tax=Tepidimonas taiwanensis TaxID=307486 RepID=A0A554XA59_9BURK|nr:AMP-binding protein [Tepidimonas taiwanensis]MCX7692266.1 AMP-binding protein [Tepidimonas taiwanensis]TSE32698.1 Phenylacetate-coenzyme A ligase [Tepidimonas taiwanensis]UBQ05435.1 AMP-binding protein [Tepidimonas taiwanensis]
MPAHFDTLETRSPAEREAALFAALPGLIAHARAHGAAWARRLADIDPATITSRAALARVPVLRKHDLMEQQQAARAAGGDPFAGLATIGWRGLLRERGARRVFQSPGPIYEPEGYATDYWRSARALVAAGFEAGDLVHNAFSYHLTPGAWIMEAGAQAIGCTVFPAGVGNTEQQLAAIADLRPVGYTGTPSFLRILAEKAEAAGTRLPIRKALVSGEAFPPSLRDWLAERGIAAYQAYATADVGLIAYETSAREGLVVDEGVILEIVRPGTGDPVPDGEVGEVVVTVLNPDYPLIRFGTGDLSAVLPGPCPTGRTNTRIRGWLGRADQTTKIKGMFVHPTQVAEVVRRHAEVRRARLVVSGRMADDRMTLRVETDAPSEALQRALQESLRAVTKLHGEVELLAVGTLPNDGKVIEDARVYD